jgi:hypothetical protein
MNIFQYVENDPVNYTDPSGLLKPGNVKDAVRIGKALADGLKGVAAGAGLAAGVAGAAAAIGVGAAIIQAVGLYDDLNTPTVGPEPAPACRAGGKPNGCPPGTIPIDQYGLDRETIHRIKKDLGLGPTDWTGIDPNGNICIDDGAGQCECVDNIDGYFN